MDDRKILHVCGSMDHAMLLALAAMLLKRASEDEKYVVVNHGDASVEPTITAPPMFDEDLLKMSDKYEHYRKCHKCLVCGQICAGKDKFCNAAHRLEWRRRGR